MGEELIGHGKKRSEEGLASIRLAFLAPIAIK